MSRLKSYGIGVLSLAVVLVILGATPLQAAPRDGVFIHLSHGITGEHAGEHIDRVLMALHMASMMAADRDVLVYFDSRGVEVVLRDAEDVQSKVFESSKTLLKKLIDQKVGLYVCPSCLKVHGKSPSDLMPGVKIAEKDAFFDFTEGRILTLDY